MAIERGRWLPSESGSRAHPLLGDGHTYDRTGAIHSTNALTRLPIDRKTYSNDDRTFACELNYGHSQAALTNPHRKPLLPLGQPQGSHGHRRDGMGSRRHRQGPPQRLGEGVAKPTSSLPDPRKVLWQQKRSSTFNKPSNRLAGRDLLGRSGSLMQLDGERIRRVRGRRGRECMGEERA